MNNVTGFRQTGHRKAFLIIKANNHLTTLAKNGVHIATLRKVLGLQLDVNKLTTKQLTGVIGRIVQFRRENGI